MTGLWVAIGFALGAVVTMAALAWMRNRQYRAAGPELLPADVRQVVDLLRRAHGAEVVCLTLPDGDPVQAFADPPPLDSLVDRTQSAARLALNDGGDHVMREGGTIIAVGDGQMGLALLLGADHVSNGQADAIVSELRRLLATFELQRRRELATQGEPLSLPDWVANGAQSLEGLSHSLAEAVRAVTNRSVAVVIRDQATSIAAVVAVSYGTDRRLIGHSVSPESVVGRACVGDVPVVARTGRELFGHSRLDRRKAEEIGIAFPLRSGRDGVGALIVFGPHDTLDGAVRENVQWLTYDAGPRLASASAVRVAESQALTDPLTGLTNRRGLERALAAVTGGPCALLYVDLDHFKTLNDGFGHAVGDAALKHASRIFRRALRENDIAARTGGEEFALWLPGANLKEAAEVAERVRGALGSSKIHLGGSDLVLTCSIGVAAVPESVGQVPNLHAAADAALYQAKQKGRNRVELAQGKTAGRPA